MAKKKKRKQKLQVQIKAKKAVDLGGLTFFKVSDTLWAQPKSRKGSKKDKICTSYISSIKDVFVGKDGLSISAQIKLSQLEAFMRNLRQDVAKFKAWDKERKKSKQSPLPSVCLRHISPDLTFVVDYNA